MKKNSHSSDMLEHSVDMSSPMLSPRRSKTSTNETFHFMLRVINSSFIFSTLSLPFYFQMIGIIMGTLGFLFFFLLSFVESLLLLDLKYFARSKKKEGTLTQLFEIFKMPPYVPDIYRTIMALNAIIYLILLLSIFQSSIQSLIHIMADQENFSEWAKVLSSQQFIQFIGSVLMIPFFIKWKYPVYLVAFARVLGMFSIMFIIISVYAHSSTDTGESLLPSSSTIIQSFISSPTILMAFAYHSQFFTGKFSEKGFDNDDLEKKLKLGALYGSLIMMSVELTLSILAAIALYPVNQTEAYYGNLIRMMYQYNSMSNQLGNTFYYIFYICLAISAQLQVLQYVPQATVLILNITKKDKKNDNKIKFKHPSQELMIADAMFGKQEIKKNPQTIKSNLKKSLVLHKSTAIQHNKKRSLFVSITVYSCAFLFAMAKPPILMLACLMGATTQNFVTFLIPSILYLDKQFKVESNIYKKCFAWFTLIFSICFACSSVSFGLYGLYTNEI